MTCKEFIRRFGTENDMCVYETEFYGKIDPLSETAEGAEYGINCGRGLSLQEMRAQSETNGWAFNALSLDEIDSLLMRA